MAFFYRITEAYKQKAQLNKNKYAIIDASQSINNVKLAIERAFEEFKDKLL
jgi:thymidylate kinase